MEFYRVKQFIWAVNSIFKKVDYDLINEYLNNEEKELFATLKNGDKQHCIRVCKDCIKEIEESNQNIDKYKLAKAALLHDIGKSEYKLNAIQKSILVLADKATSSKIKKYENIKVIDAYYNHPKKGVKILNSIKSYDKEILEVVSNHHKDDYFTENTMFNIIKHYDNKN